MKSRLIAALLLSLTAAGAFAADQGFYVYGSAGVTDTNRKGAFDAGVTSAGATAFSSSADEKDSGYKLQAGYRYNKYLAVEGGYVDLGKFMTYHANVTAPVVRAVSSSMKADGWNLGVVAGAPVSDTVSLFGKLGVYSYKAKWECSGCLASGATVNREDKGTPLYYGIGAAWNFTPNWFARAEYEVFQDVGESFNSNATSGTTRADVKMGSVGVGYRF